MSVLLIIFVLMFVLVWFALDGRVLPKLSATFAELSGMSVSNSPQAVRSLNAWKSLTPHALRH
jgi:hypothetical protein